MARHPDLVLPTDVDPDRLLGLLEESGWKIVGGRDGAYKRLAPPGADVRFGDNLLLPLDRTSPEFERMLNLALAQLSEDRDFWVRSISPRLTVRLSDEFRFRKESAAPSGLIAWNDGEELIRSARKTLLAGAKYFAGSARHFANKYGQFASRYLDNVLMGQTAPGSYIVTALAPVNATVPLHGGLRAAPDLEGANVVQAREISEAVVRSVQATVEALDHFHHSGSLSGFEIGVPRGISYEMTSALQGIASNSGIADITVEWDPSYPGIQGSPAVSFELKATDAPVLAKAASTLSQDAVSQRETITGRVHLLSRKEAGSPGVFGIDSIESRPPRKVRVRLAEDDDYHEAVRAHEEELVVRVSGVLKKEGNLSWLYNATLVETLGPLHEIRPRRFGAPVEIEGQLDILSDTDVPELP